MASSKFSEERFGGFGGFTLQTFGRSYEYT